MVTSTRRAPFGTIFTKKNFTKINFT